MSTDTIRFEVDNGVATITLNRVATLNAFNDLMIQETIDAFKQAGRDDSVRAVILTGAGRGFSSGQDLAEFRDHKKDVSVSGHLRGGYHKLIQQMLKIEKPIIGAINGVAAGAGLGIALACDLRIAAQSAVFMLAFSKIGLIPDAGINWLLPRMIGYPRAYQMAITADKVKAQSALAWGMINEVVADEALAETAQSWGRRFASGPTLAFGLTKRAMLRAFEQDFETALEYEANIQEIAARSHDNVEGIAAFLEKRPPTFTGR